MYNACFLNCYSYNTGFNLANNRSVSLEEGLKELKSNNDINIIAEFEHNFFTLPK